MVLIFFHYYYLGDATIQIIHHWDKPLYCKAVSPPIAIKTLIPGSSGTCCSPMEKLSLPFHCVVVVCLTSVAFINMCNMICIVVKFVWHRCISQAFMCWCVHCMLYNEQCLSSCHVVAGAVLLCCLTRSQSWTAHDKLNLAIFFFSLSSFEIQTPQTALVSCTS